MLIAALSGCAVAYHDPETGADHIWGFGHMVTRVTPPNENRIAVITGIEIVGFGVSLQQDARSVTLGWSREGRTDVLAENAAVAISVPEDDPTRLRVGTSFDDLPSAQSKAGEGKQ